MRVSDQEYSRDQRSFHLALRMLRHEARLNTICAWTKFTEERVRNLSRSHRRQQPRQETEPHRGPSPKRLAPLLATASLRSEVAALAGLCRLLGIIPEARLPNARKRLPSVTLGERLCEAFEFFQEIVPFARLTFEQLVFLVFAVAEGEMCSIDLCVSCRAVILVDHLSLARRVCVHCQNAKRVAADGQRREGEPTMETPEEPLEPPGSQRRLFD